MPSTGSGPEHRLVEVRGVTCSYGGPPVLIEIDLRVDPGSYIGIVGPSGSGKSTLLRVLAGSMQPSSGSVERRRGVRVGFVPQVEYVNWNFPVTVSECVMMARTHARRLPWPSRAEKAALADVLDRLGIGDLADRHIRALSGGQQQRMFIARALLTDADLLLLDEPTSGLDIRTRHEVLHLLDDLRRESLAVVMTTHDLNGIAAHLPELVCLNERVIGWGAPAEVFTSEVLERTFGAPMQVLMHSGLPVVIDRHRPHGHGAPDHIHDPESDVAPAPAHDHDRAHDHIDPPDQDQDREPTPPAALGGPAP